ncbi:MAG TPA: sporulation protein YabP [Pseudogracilibacillus sp.]|nr:sporulation protein YabP [Pseudogracilibacillus sp.]
MNLYEKIEATEETSEHRVIIHNRNEVEINGVKEVDSFDHEEFLLETTMGYLLVRGRNLQLKSLHVEEGIVQIEGKLNEMLYVDEQIEERAKGLFSKLFK